MKKLIKLVYWLAMSVLFLYIVYRQEKKEKEWAKLNSYSDEDR